MRGVRMRREERCLLDTGMREERRWDESAE